MKMKILINNQIHVQYQELRNTVGFRDEFE